MGFIANTILESEGALDNTENGPFWHNQPFDPNLPDYVSLLYPNYAPDSVLGIGPYFTYIYDCYHGCYHFISKNIDKVLGYREEELMNINKGAIYDAIHPEDREAVISLAKKSWKYIRSVKPDLRKKYKISMDFRVRKHNQEYVRILLQKAILNQDKMGNVVHIVGICTDISHWHKDNEVTLTIAGTEDEQMFLNYRADKVEEQNVTLSDRERQILALIARGYSSKSIAGDLSISPHTVNSHRRNMMDKLGIHKTINLVNYALSKGLI